MKVFYLFILLFLSSDLYSQSIIDDIEDEQENTSEQISNLDLPTERIEKVGASRTVFILSNNNSSFNKGDFISLVLGDNLINRAIVAKVAGSSVGIKVVKTYSPELGVSLRPGTQVKVIRGDDTYFNNLKKKQTAKSNAPLIEDEDDLFNDTTLLSDEVSLEENSKRHLRTDSLFFVMASALSSFDNSGNEATYNQFGASYGYQFRDNFWAEVYYSSFKIDNFPSTALTSTFNLFSLRLKYTVKLPSYVYLQPYVGLLLTSISAPNTTNMAQTSAIDLASERRPAVGVTLLRRLVPGWFIRGDLGTDLMALGFGLEF